MAAAIPGSRLVAVEQCGHMAPMERPQAVAAALGQWLHDVERHEDSSARAATPAEPRKKVAP
jgi:hypothetical protein